MNIVTPAETINDIGKEMEIWNSIEGQATPQRARVDQMFRMAERRGYLKPDRPRGRGEGELVANTKPAEERHWFLMALAQIAHEKTKGARYCLRDIEENYEEIWYSIHGNTMGEPPTARQVELALRPRRNLVDRFKVRQGVTGKTAEYSPKGSMSLVDYYRGRPDAPGKTAGENPA